MLHFQLIQYAVRNERGQFTGAYRLRPVLSLRPFGALRLPRWVPSAGALAWFALQACALLVAFRIGG